MKKTKKKNSRKIVLLLGILTVIVILMIVITIIVISSKKEEGPSKDTKTTKEEIATQLYTYNKAVDITAELSDGTATLNYGNSDGNKDFLQYVIKLSGEVIYTSEKLRPGEVVGQVKLDLPKDIKTGVYDVTVELNSYQNKFDTESSQGVIQKVKLKVQ